MAIALSMLVHAAVLVTLSHNNSIEISSRKGRHTYINFSLVGDNDSSLAQKDIPGDGAMNNTMANTVPDWKIPDEKIKHETDREYSEKRTVASSMSAHEVQVMENYESAVLQLINRNKYYPSFSRRTGQEGKVMLSFTITKNGCLKGPVSIVRACSHDLLNRAGVETINASVPFPVIPDELGRQEMAFTVIIDFNLKEYMGRNENMKQDRNRLPGQYISRKNM